jgi:hypothetical protein
MPEGLAHTLTRDEFVDLVQYLVNLKKSVRATRWHYRE